MWKAVHCFAANKQQYRQQPAVGSASVWHVMTYLCVFYWLTAASSSEVAQRFFLLPFLFLLKWKSKIITSRDSFIFWGLLRPSRARKKKKTLQKCGSIRNHSYHFRIKHNYSIQKYHKLKIRAARNKILIEMIKSINTEWTYRNLDICPKNDVIWFSRKGFCALRLGLRLRLGEIRLSFGQTSIRASFISDRPITIKLL